LKKAVSKKKKKEKVEAVEKIPEKPGIEKVKRAEKKKISLAIVPIINKATALDKEAKNQVLSIQKEISKYLKAEIIKIRKGKTKEKVRAVPEKQKVVKKPVKKAILSIAGYKEAFNLGDFLRKNAFKFVFLLLLIGWFIELFLLASRLKSPQARLKMIVGEEITETRKTPPKKQEEKETAESTLLAKKKTIINIEGERDPFSSGKLTMEVMKKLKPTNIVLAREPEIITIVKKPKVISILKKATLMKPEKASTISKPSQPSPYIVSKETELSTIGKITKPQVSPIIIPKGKCHLIYRGRMIFNGVEYFFIEGEKRTYRVTIGDIVEGFKILRKEKRKLFLSKNGAIYEINAY